MLTPKSNRRVLRTQALLLDALLFLMLERGYDKVTVQDLLDRANVGRATFYAHYQSKEDLLASSIDRLRNGLLEEWKADPLSGGADARLGFTLAFFRHIHSHQQIYHAIVGRESEIIVERHMRRMLRQLVRESLTAKAHWPAPAVDVAVHYVVGALWSIVVWWMESRAQLNAEEMNELFQRLTLPGLDAALSR
jgi:AcrR family transcriptional regulator